MKSNQNICINCIFYDQDRYLGSCEITDEPKLEDEECDIGKFVRKGENDDRIDKKIQRQTQK
jgi:hypothetical protein